MEDITPRKISTAFISDRQHKILMQHRLNMGCLTSGEKENYINKCSLAFLLSQVHFSNNGCATVITQILNLNLSNALQFRDVLLLKINV